MQARPTAVISFVPLICASALTKGSSHAGMDFQSFRIMKARLLTAPSSRLKRVEYSLSSRLVRDIEIRWVASVFCSCSTCEFLSKYSFFTFEYLASVGHSVSFRHV